MKSLNSEKYMFGFELFGLDYMITKDLKLFLIEINTNPSLTILSPVTGRVISSVIENVLRYAIDLIVDWL
jgi:D-alanine-D-alanine ligase-like ATP-grasp enzyme